MHFLFQCLSCNHIVSSNFYKEVSTKKKRSVFCLTPEAGVSFILPHFRNSYIKKMCTMFQLHLFMDKFSRLGMIRDFESGSCSAGVHVSALGHPQCRCKLARMQCRPLEFGSSLLLELFLSSVWQNSAVIFIYRQCSGRLGPKSHRAPQC